ncbi:NADH-dependent flavin oxidoreductase [Streptococcus cuniculipharyngis]|uniref:NADH-dependent flavin oxidoreductase n=1 Tax=Streptococcus cuniculipharyngis TaxID=1562651 RepID=A0A5C5SFZ1_9STRE|nr:NADH-dependent flavin oxidoreductase [Streptococcus cuniculipharyngis]TWS98821.1 NADH-dependent flavin oxidoreductase [Streptococcus cuniculipharyngis]
MRYEDLFEPLLLPNGISLANRFVLSPMVTNSSSQAGQVSSADLAYAHRRCQSAPLQITGAAYISPFGQLFEYGFSVSSDEDIPGLSQLAQVMKSDGAKAILQLTHAGRFSSHSLRRFGYVYGPSPMVLQSPRPHQVRELTAIHLKNLISDYAKATSRAIKAGFDGVEISSAQRLLIQSFFSTFSNQRQDQYGCQSLLNRSRLGLDILQAVAEVVRAEAGANFILGWRGTPEETRGQAIGYSLEEFCQFINWALDIYPLDYLAIASWGQDVFRNQLRSGPNKGRLVNQVMKEQFTGRLPIMATGGINSPEKALEALEQADFIGLSTPFVVDPEFVHKIRLGQTDQIRLKIKPEDLSALAIPEASFKDLVPLMDYGKSLPQEVRQLFRQLEKNYQEQCDET